MLTATGIAIFIIPMLFVLVERASQWRKPQGQGVLQGSAQSGGSGGRVPAAPYKPE
jgi:hypothetical protein